MSADGLDDATGNGFEPDGARAPVKLTAREQEVLRRTSYGQTNAQVAAGLGLTVHAVKFHLASIFRKLNVPNRTEAAVFYLQHVDRELS
jgi:DNA-binding CsgD family transcriptional regulator